MKSGLVLAQARDGRQMWVSPEEKATFQIEGVARLRDEVQRRLYGGSSERGGAEEGGAADALERRPRGAAALSVSRCERVVGQRDAIGRVARSGYL